MADYKDKMGTEIEVGNVIVYGCGSYADIYIGMVTKRNPTLVQVNGNANANPKQSLVITDQYKKYHAKKYKDMYDKYKDKFQKDVKTRDVIRYLVDVAPHEDNNKVSVIVKIQLNGVLQPLKGEDFIANRLCKKIVRSSRSPSMVVKDSLKISRYGYPDKRTRELPAKIIKSTFGGVPTESTIIETFDNMDLCKKYLQSIGVQV